MGNKIMLLLSFCTRSGLFHPFLCIVWLKPQGLENTAGSKPCPANTAKAMYSDNPPFYKGICDPLNTLLKGVWIHRDTKIFNWQFNPVNR